MTSLQNYLAPHDFIYSEIAYTNYNNFIIFERSFFHLVDGQNLYIRYVAEHADYFKYSPAFALFMGFFSLFPTVIGLVLWNLGGALLLLAGISAVVEKPAHRLIILLLLLPELVNCLSNTQSNSHITGLLLLSYASLEKQQPGKASVFLMVTVFIKLFSIAFLPLFLLFPNKKRASLWLLVSAVTLFFSPIVLTRWTGLLQQYANWLELLKTDHSISSGLGVAGLIEAWSGVAVNKQVLLVVGAVVLVTPLLNYRFFGERSYRCAYLCLVLLWVVLFNHKAESPTYIIAMTGVVLFAWSDGFRGFPLYFLCAAILCTSLATTDLVPYDIRKNVVAPFRIKAIVPTIILFFVWGRLMLTPFRSAPVSGAE